MSMQQTVNETHTEDLEGKIGTAGRISDCLRRFWGIIYRSLFLERL